MNKLLIVKCPICKHAVKRENETFPFCSERCKTNDLGNWASGAYSIPDRNDSQPFDDDDESHLIH